LLLMRLDADCLRPPVVGQLRMQTQTDVDAKISASTHLCE